MISYRPRWHKRTGTDIGNPAMHVSANSECNQVVACYKDFSKHRVTFPRRDRHNSKEGYTPVNQCVRSNSKLPRLSGSTKRHFPIKSTTRGTQLGVESHTYRCTSHVRTTCPICIDTTMASQHNHTTTQHLFRRLRRAMHNMFIQVGVT